jgi:hypothetical protein
MNIKLSTCFVFLELLFFSKGFTQSVEKFTIDNNTYYGTKAIPDEIIGFYQYEKTKEPIVDIRKDGTGLFQVHDVKAYPVEFWIETDEKGLIQKQTSQANSNYKVVLIVKYGSNGESGWRGANAGTYTRIDVGVAYNLGYVIVLGERFKKL